MLRSRRLSLLALSLVGCAVPAAVVACSSDSSPSGSSGTTAPDASPTSTATSTATSTSTTPPPPPVDGGQDAASEAGACSSKGESDVKPTAANSGTDPSGKVTVKMVDACSGTTPSQAYAGTRLKFTPTDGTNHYFLFDSTNAADFYKSASVVYNFPLAGIRGDTDVKLFAKPGSGGATDSFGANYDATKAHFVVQINKLAAACDAGGFTVSVVGHAEAVVHYSNGANFATDLALTASMGMQGAFAFISKVDPGTGLVDIVGTKTGCKLVGPAFPVAISTNKYPLIADTVTYVVGNTSL
jgi:hypothetical protein